MSTFSKKFVYGRESCNNGSIVRYCNSGMRFALIFARNNLKL
jgi:hypothetical protein